MDIYIWLTVKQFWLSKNNRDSYLFTWDMMAQSFATKELVSGQDWVEVPQVLFRLSRWENLEHAKEI